MMKMTFTFVEETVATLRRTASRLKKPQSAILREAIQDYEDQSRRLSEDDRQRMLKLLEGMVARTSHRTARDVNRELAEIAASRKTGGSKTRP